MIEARVLQATANKVVQVQGTPCELKTYEVCDRTGQTGITVWDRLILSVQEGNSCRFETLTTRKEGDRTVLTTTPATVITTTAEVGHPASLRPITVRGEETLRGLVTGVQIVAKPRCRRCHAGQDNLAVKSSTDRCERCAIQQSPTSYIISYSGVLILVGGDGEEHPMSFTNSAVFTFVRDNFLSSSGYNGPALEETVMALSELEVTVNEEGLVVRFAAAAESEPTAEQSGRGSVPDASLGESTQADEKDAEDVSDALQASNS